MTPRDPDTTANQSDGSDRTPEAETEAELWFEQVTRGIALQDPALDPTDATHETTPE